MMTTLSVSKIKVWVGLDVGKGEHHACALNEDGKRLFDKPLPQDETKLRKVLTSLQTHGPVLLIVDQPNTIGALPVAVAQNCGCQVAYLPGSAMHKAAQLLPGDAKTDARDAFVIAITGLRMPNTLRKIDPNSETLANLKVLSGFDEDLTHETTRAINRLRSLLLQIHPALERVFTGSKLTTELALDLLTRYGGPNGLNHSNAKRVTSWAIKTGHRSATKLVEDIFQALSEQSVTVAGTEAVEQIIPTIATTIKTLKTQRRELATKVETLLEDFPLHQVLVSMPGVGAKTAATILLTIGDASGFPTAGHLAAYAGIAPTTRRSGSSIRGEHPARGGNKQLKNALFHSAFVAAFCDPESHTYYERKRSQGKRHNAAIICLARRRCDVLYAMLKHSTPYQPRHPENLPIAA